MEPYFALSVDADAQYSFNFFDKNGTLMLMSGQHANKEEAEKTIKEVKVGTLMSTQIAAGKTPTGEMFFLVKDGTGQVIAKSVLFNNQMVFNNALHTVKDTACVAETRDLSVA